jgi:hypothetical protein
MCLAIARHDDGCSKGGRYSAQFSLGGQMDWHGFTGGRPPARREVLIPDAMERSIQQVDASILARSGRVMLPAIGQTIHILYRDTKAQESSRRINVTCVRHHDGHQYVDAWCHERAAP